MTGKKVLVVDDDPDILDVITMILESQSYQVVVAHDGIECLDRLSAEKPDLVILDLLMPKMDGFAVYKELKTPRWSKYRDMPILILSSVREEASRRRYELETGQELSVDNYVEKPILPNVLLDCVEKLLKRKQRV
ncbi:MAG TPA: response regulator [Dehalococcoidia bacterium]|nr:response regulator [Dehalococcoidia bacterium]